jgi:predicted transcriptional regulator
VFTARYELSPYIKQIIFCLQMLNKVIITETSNIGVGFITYHDQVLSNTRLSGGTPAVISLTPCSVFELHHRRFLSTTFQYTNQLSYYQQYCAV